MCTATVGGLAWGQAHHPLRLRLSHATVFEPFLLRRRRPALLFHPFRIFPSRSRERREKFEMRGLEMIFIIDRQTVIDIVVVAFLLLQG